AHPFRKLNALADAQECRSFFSKYVDDWHEVLSFSDQGLFTGILSPDSKLRPRTVPALNVALAPRKKPWPRSRAGVVGWLRRARATAWAAGAERVTYRSPEGLSRRETPLSAVLREGTPGDFLDFGGALGGSAIVLANHARHWGRRFHGFDVFGMIPAPTSDKDDAKSKERYEVIASGRSRGIGGDTYYGYRRHLLDEVRTSFARHGIPVDGNTVELHKGQFQETWANYGGRAVALAHIDCDWYDPVKFCLEHLADRMSSGGVIILDDYHDYGGCR